MSWSFLIKSLIVRVFAGGFARLGAKLAFTGR